MDTEEFDFLKDLVKDISEVESKDSPNDTPSRQRILKVVDDSNASDCEEPVKKSAKRSKPPTELGSSAKMKISSIITEDEAE